ncbi:MAG TPA: S53 family peptidase [Edaphobacter sp.]|nr:S53 family peptidase [Edaphobacter sp.]
MKLFHPAVRPLLVVALLFCSLPAFPQTLEPRLKGNITEASRIVLPNSRTPRVRAAQDLGAVSPDTTVTGITLVFKRSAAQEATLKDLLAAQQNIASPLYHHWLTPETFAARFGIADQDITTAETWLVSRGFHIENVARSRDRITFSGTAAQVQAAFGTDLHHYQTEGELHFAPASDLTLPAELASVTAAVLHLSDFRPKPNIQALETHPQPNYTTLSTQAHYLTPADIETMYNLKPLTSNFFDGTGQELAVVGQSYVDTSTSSSVSTFQRYFDVVNQVNAVLVPGTGVKAISPGDEGESEIDIEYSSAIAPKANIFLVYVGASQNYDVFDALAYTITENIAPVVSISYGLCEAALSQSELDQSNALFEEASAQGQTLVAASGDSGSTSCAYYTSAEGITATQQQALSVNFPASSPNVTAVGGTQMAAGTFGTGASSYWTSASVTDITSSLLSYAPEVVWNEDSAAFGIAAGGGGTSTYFPRPTWQSGVSGISSGAYRLLPDLALQSSIVSPGFLLCSDDRTLIGSQTSSCTNGFLGSSNRYTIAGGTSFATPIFAGFLAILNQAQQVAGQGNINPVLYGLAANPTTYANAFHDITSGSNACLPSAATCSTAGKSSYAATSGYDLATGLGSVDFNALTTAWPSSSSTNLQPTFVTLIVNNSTPAPGENDLIQINVGATYLPNHLYAPTSLTGSVSVSVDGSIVNPSLTLSTSPINMTGIYNLVAPATTGSHLIAVTYSGDATHSSSTATSAVTVGNVIASGGLSLTAGNLTIANGGTGSTQITVTPTAGYNGNIVWSLSSSGNSTSLTACYTIASLPVSKISTTQLTIGIGTACNSALPAERGNFRSLDQRTSTNDGPPTHRRSTTTTAMYASLLICGLLAGGRRRIRLPLLLAIAFLTVTGLSLTGCGGGGNNTGTPTMGTSTTPSSTTSYTMTLTAKDSVNSLVTASTTFTLTVK